MTDWKRQDLRRLGQVRRVIPDGKQQFDDQSSGPQGEYFDISVAAGATVILNASGAYYEQVRVDYYSGDNINNWSNAAAIIFLTADAATVAIIHTGLAFVMPSVRKWEIRNPTGTSQKVRGFLYREIQNSVVPPLCFGVDVGNGQNFRPLTLSGTGELLVTQTGAGQAQSSPLNLNSATQAVNGTITGVGNPVNQVILSGVVGQNITLTNVGMCAAGLPPAGGDIIYADIGFSAPAITIIRIAISPGLNDSISHSFGDSGPKTNAAGSVRATVNHILGGGDGWFVWACGRYAP